MDEDICCIMEGEILITKEHSMPRLIPDAERITRARVLIQKARDLPPPAELGRFDLSYVAGVKGFIQQARDLVKFLPYKPASSAETKAEVTRIFKEAEQAEKEILHPKAS